MTCLTTCRRVRRPRQLLRLPTCPARGVLPTAVVGAPPLTGLAGLLVLAGGVAGTHSARAQTLAPIPPAAEAGLAGLDTTLRLGRRDFAPYSTPGECVAAARATEALAHHADPDSASYAPEQDTLASATVAVARRCGARFTVNNVTPAELLDLARLALLQGDDAAAHAAVGRYVTAQHDPVQQRWALYAADTMYLNATPMRRVAAEAITAQLDSLGPAAALQRKLAHTPLLEVAQRRYDVEQLRREVLALLAACHQESAADSQDVLGGNCNEASLVAHLFLAELFRDTTGAVERTRRLVSTTGFTDWTTFTTIKRITRLDWTVAQMGKPLPPLVADQWSGPKGRAPGWPVRGKVSLFLHGHVDIDNLSTMARWKRLAEEFKDALDITVLVPAKGYFAADNREPGSPELMLTPAQEVERVGQFYREQLGVPVTVALVEPPVQLRLPPPDGRILRGEPAFLTDPYYSATFLLGDRAGKFLMGGIDLPEPALRAWVARTVGR